MEGQIRVYILCLEIAIHVTFLTRCKETKETGFRIYNPVYGLGNKSTLVKIKDAPLLNIFNYIFSVELGDFPKTTCPYK